MVEVAGECAFDAALGFLRALSGVQKVAVVRGGFGVVVDALEGDYVQCLVELAVAAVVEAVSLVFAAGRVDGAGAGQGREGRLACHPFGIAA